MARRVQIKFASRDASRLHFGLAEDSCYAARAVSHEPPSETAAIDGARDSPKSLLRYFFYLSPLWLIIEWWFWPGLRADQIVGDGWFAILVFHLVEFAIAGCFLMRVRFSEWIGLVYNLAYLLLSVWFVYAQPIVLVSDALSGSSDVPARAHDYFESLPGILWSMAYLAFFVALKFGRAVHRRAQEA